MASPVRAVGRSLGRVPRLVLAATLAFALLLSLYSVAIPLGEAPDETPHADLVFHLATGAAYPSYDGRRIGAAIYRLCTVTTAAIRACPLASERDTPNGIRPHLRQAAADRGARPDFTEAGGDRGIGPVNQMPQHPPLYYWAMSAVLRAERFVLPGTALPPLDRELALLRLANVVLVAPLPLLAWWTSRRLALPGPVGVVASLIPFTIPQLAHIGSTVNNDNLLTLLGAVLVALLAGVVRGDLARRTAVAVGAVTGLALLTKAFALMIPVVVLVAYAVGWRAARGRRRDAGLGLAVAGVVTAALGGWWFVANLARGDGLTPTVESRRLTTALRPPDFHADKFGFAKRFGSLFVERFWGWFGWYTVRISLALIIAATVALVGAVVAGIVVIGRAGGASDRVTPRLGPGRRLELGVLLLPVVLFAGFVLARAWSLHVRTGAFPFIQGRYLFGAIVGVTVAAGIGVHRVAGRWAPFSVLAWAAVMNTDALLRVLSTYWGGPGLGRRGQVRGLVAWSAWPGRVLGAGAVVAVAAAGWLLYETLGTTRRVVPMIGEQADGPSMEPALRQRP